MVYFHFIYICLLFLKKAQNVVIIITFSNTVKVMDSSLQTIYIQVYGVSEAFAVIPGSRGWTMGKS